MWDGTNHYLLELFMWTCYLSFYFMFLYYEDCHADVKLFCFIFLPQVDVTHVR